MKINIKTISHKEQRYNTAGDYWEDEEGVIQFRISSFPDHRYEQLVLIHELVEYFLLALAKVAIAEVDLFDLKFEENRKPGDIAEPGDDPDAPYFHQHQAASIVERVFAGILKVDWTQYDKAVLELDYGN